VPPFELWFGLFVVRSFNLFPAVLAVVHIVGHVFATLVDDEDRETAATVFGCFYRPELG
jgi:hypothetical protein